MWSRVSSKGIGLPRCGAGAALVLGALALFALGACRSTPPPRAKPVSATPTAADASAHPAAAAAPGKAAGTTPAAGSGTAAGAGGATGQKAAAAATGSTAPAGAPAAHPEVTP